jgi:putative PEP-CTERM system TPR-repeat lipoprotein
MKMRKLLLARYALAAMMAASAPQAWAADGQPAQYYEDALQRYEKHDLAGTIVQLRNALKQDRKMLQAHVLLGKALLASGQAPAAVAAFEEAQHLGVNRAELVLPWTQALVAQGQLADVVDDQKFPLTGLSAGLQARLLLVKASARGDMGDSKGALKQLEEARVLDPTAPDGWLAEVPLRIRAGQFIEALAAVDRALALDPRSAGVYLQLASVQHAQGRRLDALASYDQALQLGPALNDARVARAGLLLDLKRHEEAARDVALLLERTPREPRGWYLSAVLAERAGQAQQVRSNLTQITTLLDPVPMAYIRYRPQLMMLNGQAHFGLGQLEKAKPYLEGFARLQPGSPVAKLLGNILLTEGQADRAAETLEQYLAAAPNDTQAMALLASAYMAKGRNSRAADLMQRALKKSETPELHTVYGLSLLGAGQALNALAQLETAYQKDPSQSRAATALVGLYLRDGQNAKALTVAQTLTRQSPNNAGYQNLLGLAQAMKPDIQAARAAYEQAIQLDPQLLQAKLNLSRLEGQAQNTGRALALLSEVLKAEANNTKAMYELARLAERMHKPEDAQRWLQKAFDVGGAKDLRSSLALVDLHMRQGRKAEAMKAAQTLASSAPDSLPVFIALARTQLLNGELTGAKRSLSTANKLAPIEAPVQVEIAVLQLAAGNLPGAAYAAGKALEAQPEDLRAQAVMTDIDIQQGELPKAEARALSITAKAPKLAIGTMLLGDVALARQQLPQALALYRKAHQIEPSGNTVRKLVATQARMNTQLAAPLAQRWLKDHPQDQETRRLLGELYVRTGNMSGAKEQYLALQQLLPQDPGAANDLANVLAVLQDPQALTVAEKALSLAPNDANVIDTAGWTAHLFGKTDRALLLLRDARLRGPDKPVIRYHLGAALAKAGRKAEAVEELTAALQTKGGFDGRGQAESQLKSLK